MMRASWMLWVLLLFTRAAFAEPPRAFDIPVQDLALALELFAKQADKEVLFDRDQTRGRRSSAVRGELEPVRALRSLTSASGLAIQQVNERTFVVGTLRTGLDDAAASPERITLASSQEGTSNSQPHATAESNAVEEIVVTAQKRAQRLNDVPMSISAISNEEIDRRGLVGISDYLRTLPGVAQLDLGAGRNSIIMRGVSSDPQNDPSGQTVGYYLNDIPLTGYTYRGGADIKLVDLQRVEVLRGPQGTLYGSAALGGAVRNVPNPPDLNQFKAYAKAGYSYTEEAGGDNSSVEGVLNLPVVAGKIALRAVAYRVDNSGYVENIAGSDPATLAAAQLYGISNLAVNEGDIGSDRYTGARISMLVQPTDRLQATVTYLTQDILQRGLPEVELVRPGKFQQARLQLGELVGGGGERLADDIDIYNASIEYGFDWGVLLSSSSWIREDNLEKRGIGSFFGGMPIPQRNPGEARAFAQEVRFASSFKGPLQLLAGLYYEDVHKKFRALNFFGGADPLLNPFGQTLLTDQLLENAFTQKAVFGEVSYAVTSRLNLTVGARRFRYDRTDTTTDVDSAFAAAGVQTLKNENDGTTRKINLAYKVADQSLLYAQWAEGFRLGKSLAPMSPLCDLDADGLIDGTSVSARARQLDPDTIESHEIGAKHALMEGALRVNVAVFRNNWNEVPIALTAACGFPAIDNANAARTQGVELGSELNLMRNLRISAAASYVEAELSRDAVGIGAAGDRLPGSPRYALSLGAQYDFALRGMPSFLRGDLAHVGGFYNNLKQTGVELGDYSQLNLRMGVTLNRVGIELFINNVTNSDALTWLDNTFDGVDDRAYRLRPRTVGLNARIGF